MKIQELLSQLKKFAEFKEFYGFVVNPSGSFSQSYTLDACMIADIKEEDGLFSLRINYLNDIEEPHLISSTLDALNDNEILKNLSYSEVLYQCKELMTQCNIDYCMNQF
ncbi:hypothetical protein AVV36_gp102 [Pectobacterium bacteriophage PM2]|uniref:Uncharacterized protein n=1 Tax=Pectobacterium bacteriophage PM2 TaxID=1429794 RepID=A0A0A0PZG7_9CAUD|nr:hypothetical protein AVV36_gp102 [Pectobacterium bacteriophage PM2]AHY25064.1 hypothetical protein PM2_102 [Pectobacterium bacteriophage PM2]